MLGYSRKFSLERADYGKDTGASSGRISCTVSVIVVTRGDQGI